LDSLELSQMRGGGAADCLLAVLVPDTDDRSVSGGTVANPDAMGMAEVAEFYCALLAGELLAASCWNAGTCACGVTRARDGNFG
jgi:hypothetical protein